MAHIVMAIECHPDKLIEGVYGPFETYDIADAWAKQKEKSDDNYNVNYWTQKRDYDSRKYDYRVHELETPERGFEDDPSFYPGCHDRP